MTRFEQARVRIRRWWCVVLDDGNAIFFVHYPAPMLPRSVPARCCPGNRHSANNPSVSHLACIPARLCVVAAAPVRRVYGLAMVSRHANCEYDPSPRAAAPPGTARPRGNFRRRWRRAAAGGGLRLGYVIHGAADALARILIPESGTQIRADGLWQRTCCEAFVGVPGTTAYREFNFSPSGAWAAYAFSDYRKSAALPLGPVPPIAFVPAGGHADAGDDAGAGLVTQVAPALPGFVRRRRDPDGERSYWALAHPVAQPDFHHRDGFTQTLEMRHEPHRSDEHPEVRT